jgi:hypothetical protein
MGDNDHSVSPSFMTMTSEDVWLRLQGDFEEDASFIKSVRLENASEAVDRSSPKEEAIDPEELDGKFGPSIKHTALVPFRRTDDAEELRAHFGYALGAIPELRALFAARVPTPEFLASWGRFQCACGFVAAAYYSSGDDLGPVRSGKNGPAAKNRDAQLKWVAQLLLRQIRRGRNRQQAERDVAQAIREMLGKGALPHGFKPPWFQRIIGPDKQLRTTYSRKRLSMSAMETLCGESVDDIPPIDIPIPSI